MPRGHVRTEGAETRREKGVGEGCEGEDVGRGLGDVARLEGLPTLAVRLRRREQGDSNRAVRGAGARAWRT